MINTEINIQHLFRWEISTVRTVLPDTLLSGSSSSSGWSTLSDLWCSAPGWISPDFWQTRTQESKSIHWEQWFLFKNILTYLLDYSTSHLFSSGGQPRVSSDPSLNVEVALPVATQVDGARRDVDVHQVVDDSALDVIKDAVHQVTTAHVDDLYVGQIPGEKESVNRLRSRGGSLVWSKSFCVSSPVQDLVQRLVGGLVTLDPLHEVLDGLLCVAVDVVWAA